VSDRDRVTRSVATFYDELPFNYGETAESAAAIVRGRNQIRTTYPDLDLVLREQASSLLDVGCGAGWLSHTCAYHYGVRTLGIDLSSTAVLRAREIGAVLGLDTLSEFRVTDLFQRETAESFDVVVSLGALHHTADLAGALEIIAERVAPDGVLYLGLYHANGRRPFLELFDRYRQLEAAGALGPEDFEEALALYATLDTRTSDATLIRSWFRDQVLHPHETQHTLREIADLLAGIGFSIASTSVNRFEAFEDVADLYAHEASYEQRARHALDVERRYVPGFFTVLARRTA
jgi:SAM-dependent methyltransferase